MTRKITTLLFDLDGTLINTNELIIKTFQHTLGAYFPDRTFEHEDILPFIGPSLIDTFTGLDPERAQEMVDHYRAFNKLHHDELILEYDGVYEAIRALYEEDYKLAIVSTKMYDMILKGLKTTGLDKYFQVVIGLDQVASPKPDPEGINMALKLLNSTADEAIMVGDNYHDIEAAHNANVQSAGVSWAIRGADYLRDYNPTYILESMGDLLDIVRED